MRLGLTQTEFAKLISEDVTKQKTSRLENGQNLPDVFELRKIAIICGKPMEYFVADDDYEEQKVSDKNRSAYGIFSDDEPKIIWKPAYTLNYKILYN